MLCSLHLQKGEAPEALAASKRELEIKRAGSASKGAKIFYKVTVKVTAFPHPSHARVKSPGAGRYEHSIQFPVHLATPHMVLCLHVLQAP